MSVVRRFALPAFLLLLGLGAVPAQATLRVTSGSSGLRVFDKNGLSDTVLVSAATLGGDPVFVVTNQNAFDVFKFDRGAGCNPGSSSDKVVCSYGNGRIDMDMGDGSDFVKTAGSGATHSDMDLGTGSDATNGTNGPDTISAGGGDDNIETLAGNDRVEIGGGKNTVDTGSGNDEIVSGIVDTSKPGGRLEGGSGDDVIFPGDATRAGAAITVLGGSGDDNVSGGEGDDAIDGGSGVDLITAGRGDDNISSREVSGTAFRDTVRCGFWNDDVTADLKDNVELITNPGGGTCEEVDRGPVGETPNVIVRGATLRVSPTGKVKVRLRCPRGTHKLGCKGKLQLRVARTRKGGVQAGRSRKVRYKIKAGRRKTVTLRLTGKDVRTLRRLQRRGKKPRGILVSVEKGRKGRKTTVRNPRLKLRRR